MDDDRVDPSFEAGVEARAAQEQRLLALLDLRAGDVRQAIAERPLVVKRKSPEAAKPNHRRERSYGRLLYGIDEVAIGVGLLKNGDRFA